MRFKQRHDIVGTAHVFVLVVVGREKVERYAVWVAASRVRDEMRDGRFRLPQY